MYLDLPGILTQAFAPGAPAAFRQLVGYVDRVPAIAALGASADALTARLLWLSGHTMAASAASHGLQLGYVEFGPGELGDQTLSALADELPTSLVLKAFHAGEALGRPFACGGEKTQFEKTDLKLLEHGQQPDDRIGIVVARFAEGFEGGADELNALVARQRILAHVLVVRTEHQPTPTLPALADGWIVASLPADGLIVDVHTNAEWKSNLLALTELRYGHPGSVEAAAIDSKELPLVDVAHFSGATLVDKFPAETLVGPQLNIWGLDANNGVVLRSGRLPATITTQERLVHECTNVNVSHTGVIWRKDRALLNSFLFALHDMDKLVDDRRVKVTEPTQTLSGAYFLAPTGNTHHSHLVWETLRKLGYAAGYQPDIKLLCSSVLSQSQREYFEHFGFPPERCVYKDPAETWAVERLVFVTEHPQGHDRSSIDYLRSVGTQHMDLKAGRPTKLYFSRRDCRMYRNLVNEEEVEHIFKAFGFEIIFASDLSVQQKLELLAGAEFVAGPLGAAFTYMPFSLGARAIILTTDLYFPPVYMETAALQMRPVDYIRGIGLEFFTDAWDTQHSSFYAPPELVAVALKNIISG